MKVLLYLLILLLVLSVAPIVAYYNKDRLIAQTDCMNSCNGEFTYRYTNRDICECKE